MPRPTKVSKTLPIPVCWTSRATDGLEPDLESPPGPWWTADLAGEGWMVGWCGEFEDQRRGEEVPAVTQIYHMERSLAELQEDFGKQALELKPGNNSWSKSQFNNTAELAARVGFGLFHGQVWRTSFPTLILPTTSSTFSIHNDGPIIWIGLAFRDRDVALDHHFMERLFAALPANQ